MPGPAPIRACHEPAHAHKTENPHEPQARAGAQRQPLFHQRHEQKHHRQAYARWRCLLRGLARFKGGIGSAEDALHDGVVKWVAADPALASPTSKGAYLRKTVLNGVADEFRERQAGRRLRTVSFDEAADDGLAMMSDEASCPMRAAAHQQRLARLGEALQELPSASARPSC